MQVTTKLSREDETKAYLNQLTIQRQQQAGMFTLDREVFKKDLLDKRDLKLAKQLHKRTLKAHYGEDWKKHVNIPWNLYVEGTN